MMEKTHAFTVAADGRKSAIVAGFTGKTVPGEKLGAGR